MAGLIVLQLGLLAAREALMCRKIMAFSYSHVCRVRHAHHESTACNVLFGAHGAPYLDNGNPPYIQAISDWHRKAPFQDE